jgi:hypothetical protein
MNTVLNLEFGFIFNCVRRSRLCFLIVLSSNVTDMRGNTSRGVKPEGERKKRKKTGLDHSGPVLKV